MSITRIVIFAKAPLPGFAKTRLVPALGAEGAAQLAEQMLIRTIKAARAANLGTIELRTDPPPHDPVWEQFSLPRGPILLDQGQGDLGARMARAAQASLACEHPLLLSGTDCAEISATLFRTAAARLTEHDAVLYPSTDGGYVLLGLRRYHPTLFSSIAWSTSEVAAITLARMRALGWRIHVGAPLHDIDEPSDLGHWQHL